MQRQSVALVTSGYFPVPATLGGAVEALDENLINQNEVSGRLNLVVFSSYDVKAKEVASNYKNTEVKFVITPVLVKVCDKVIYFVAKNILKKKKSLSYRYIAQRLYFISKVAKTLRDEDFDKVVLENHSTLFITLKKHDNYKKYASKYYYHLHNIVTNDYGCREIMQHCAGVIGVSDYINSTLRSFLGDGDKSNYFVLRNKIDRDKFAISLSFDEKRALRDKYGISDDEKIVLFTGRFSEEKGIRELLDAFGKIKDENVKLLVVGGYYFGSGMRSPFEEEMKSKADKMKDRVVFTWFVEYSQIPKLYAIADVVVIPSMWDDPAPLTVIESLTAGKALITTDSGGIPEYATEESSIILKRDESLVDNLASSITTVINDSSKRNHMEKAAGELTKNWTMEAFYEDLCYLLKK